MGRCLGRVFLAASLLANGCLRLCPFWRVDRVFTVLSFLHIVRCNMLVVLGPGCRQAVCRHVSSRVVLATPAVALVFNRALRGVEALVIDAC